MLGIRRRETLCGGGSIAVVFILSLGCECAGGRIPGSPTQSLGQVRGRPRKSRSAHSMMISLREDHQVFAQNSSPMHQEIVVGTQCSFCLGGIPPVRRMVAGELGYDGRGGFGAASRADAMWHAHLCRGCAAVLRHNDTFSAAWELLPLKRRCVRCSAWALFAWLPQRGTRDQATHCELHCEHGQVRIVGFLKTCEAEGCSKARIFGPPDSQVRFCGKHKEPGDVDLKNSRCLSEGCTRQPSFGNPVLGTRTACARHRQVADVDIKNMAKRCKAAEGCTKFALFGFRKEGRPIYCSSHRCAGQVDLCHVRCQRPEGCLRQPTFGDRSDGFAKFCLAHKEPHHVDVKSSMCMYIGSNRTGCANRASFGLRGTSVALYCSAHKGLKHFDVVHRKDQASSLFPLLAPPSPLHAGQVVPFGQRAAPEGCYPRSALQGGGFAGGGGLAQTREGQLPYPLPLAAFSTPGHLHALQFGREERERFKLRPAHGAQQPSSLERLGADAFGGDVHLHTLPGD